VKPTVTFVTCPSPFLMDEKIFCALGILKVAAAAEQLGYPVEHLDLCGISNFEDAMADYCANTDAHFFALTATTPQFPAALKICDVIRRISPEKKIIIGGPHPTLVFAALKKNKTSRSLRAARQLTEHFDCVVCGDGEDAIDVALTTDLPVIDADDPKGLFFLSKERLAELPFPARHLIDMDSYHYSFDGVRATLVMGQLGCPMSCSFCGGRNSPMLRRMRLRPSSEIVAEIRHLYDVYGYRGFYFGDDELNINKQFLGLLHELGDLQSELCLDLRFRGFLKSEFITEEQAALMYQVGFREVLCGFESGSDRILRNIRKHATKDDNTRAMELSHKYNLGMKALMSIGHPGESPETVRETCDWIKAVAPVQADFTVITPYPGSPYSDSAVENGSVWTFTDFGDSLHIVDMDYAETATYYKGAPGSYQSYVFTDFMSREEIVFARDVAESEYRTRFNVPYYESAASRMYEHSIGAMPSWILRRSQ
jgi:anaerobic magnesium-protoporphyrin IX monomethyl ester cyclase